MGKVNDQHERVAVEGFSMFNSGMMAGNVRVFTEMVGSEARGSMVISRMEALYENHWVHAELVEVLRAFKGLRVEDKFEVAVLLKATEDIAEAIEEIGGALVEE